MKALHTLPLLFAATLACSAKPNVIVIFADDLGYADLGCQAKEPDVRTPHLDRFAKEGVRFTSGYVTAPQCSPSRAGLMTGRHQQCIGFDTIPDGPLPLEEVTMAEMLQPAGYITGQVGKWHLEPNALCIAWAQKNHPDIHPDKKGRITVPAKDRIAYLPLNQGFTEYFTGEMNQYYANYSLDGRPRPPGPLADKGFRIDIQTEAALAFIRRNQAKPFFLYLAYYGPHTPLELAKPYVNQFTGEMPLRRRAALSMIAGIDDGVGRVMSLLKELDLDKNTLVVFTSDNGAPLHKRLDSPINGDAGGWDGSLNTPWVGEKGMLAEGGIRVPYLARWPGTIPGGRVIDTPVSTLDIAPTALAAADTKTPANLDGTSLLSLLRQPSVPLAPRILHWRFWNQIACRDERWKYLSVRNQKEFLFDLSTDEHETRNVADQHPEILERLRNSSDSWAAGLQPPGRPQGGSYPGETASYREYFNLDLK